MARRITLPTTNAVRLASAVAQILAGVEDPLLPPRPKRKPKPKLKPKPSPKKRGK